MNEKPQLWGTNILFIKTGNDFGKWFLKIFFNRKWF